MHITHVPAQAYQGTLTYGRITYPMCMVCGHRHKLQRHEVGLKMCDSCRANVNRMIAKEGGNLDQIAQSSKSNKDH